jgi:hypothetical protein
MSVSVNPSEYRIKAAELVTDLREAAIAAGKEKPAKSWIFGLLERAKALGNRALDASVAAAVNAIAKAYVG